MACVALLAHGVFAGTHEIAHGFIGTVGNPHGGEVTGTGQTGQQHGVAPIRLDAVTRGPGD